MHTERPYQQLQWSSDNAGVEDVTSIAEDSASSRSPKNKWNSDILGFCASTCPSFSIPGRDLAIFLNSDLTLWPAFAEVSINMMFNCVALVVASSMVT